MSIVVQHRRDSRTNCEANTPAAGEFWFDTTLKAVRIGDGATVGGFLQKRWRYAYPLSPAQITADQNDYSPTDFALGESVFLTSDAARNITGLAAGGSGARIVLINRGSFDITLKNASASSIAANRFLFESDVVLRSNGSIELQYSATDSRWMRANGGTKFSTVPQELVLAGVITPAQITADQNDYAPNDSVTATKTFALAAVVRLSSDASRNITGLADARDGVVKAVLNAGTNPIVLKNGSTSSTAANRFDFGADVTLAGKQSATIRYDGTDQRWKLVAATSGAAVAAGAVTAQTLAGSAMGFSMINGAIVASVAGSALTIAIKTLAGGDPSAADPVYVLLRNATAATGDYTVMTLTAATSLVISSGSSLGVASNNLAFRVWVVGFNDAGTFRLGAINCVSGTDIYPLGGFEIASSTAEGGAGAADVAQTFYTGTAVAAKAYAVLGYMTWETGLAAAGTWSATPTRTQLFGHGVPLPGAIVQRWRNPVSGLATGTTLLPYDNTIPQNTEGDQYLQQTTAASSAANVLDVEAQLSLYSSNTTSQLSAALFLDSTANAVAAIASAVQTGAHIFIARLTHRQIANGGSVFKVRAGSDTAGTTTFNGNSGSPIFGGVMNSFIAVSEVMG